MPSILANEKYQEVLLSVFEEYHSNLEKVLELATLANNGKRPEGIENEIYSLFHHISRSICISKNAGDAIKEVEKGKNSHLRRAILDSYKIAINLPLTDAKKTTELLEDIATDPEYRECIDEAVIGLDMIRKGKAAVKDAYLQAKASERNGDFPEAMRCYNLSLDNLTDFLKDIEKVNNEPAFLLALKRIKRIEKNKKKQNRFSLFVVILTAILTAFFTFLFSNVIGPKIMPDKQTSPSLDVVERAPNPHVGNGIESILPAERDSAQQ